MKVMKKVVVSFLVLLTVISQTVPVFAVESRAVTSNILPSLSAPDRVRNGELFVSRQVEEHEDGSISVIDFYMGPDIVTRGTTSRTYTAYNDWSAGAGSSAYCYIRASGYFTYDTQNDTVSVSSSSGWVSSHSSHVEVSNETTKTGTAKDGLFDIFGKNTAYVKFSCHVFVGSYAQADYNISVVCEVNSAGTMV